jgi:selenide,water dikinase
MKLGHCVCDPSKPCPCDIFKEKNICLCAGERLEEPKGEVALTQLVEKAGCASKIDQVFLKQVLGDLPEIEDPRVLVGMPAGDDAGIYDMGDGTALVQTVDVFTPSVDDPYMFGQVAAANSVSDVYAMGGKPLTALSVIGFPVRKIPDKAMFEILRGGIDKMKEAGVAVIGGHSINDDQVKAGFAVTGLIDKDKVSKNSAAQVGDVLILTKPLGTGIVAFAKQIGRAKQESVEAAQTSMTTLNKHASELMVKFGAHACTDVTGFSLMGHLTEMALRSGVDAEIVWDDLPWFEGVIEYAKEGILSGAIERNKESCGDKVITGKNVSEEMVDMCYDAQTSGGLLIAISKDKAEKFLKALHDGGVKDAVVIGRIKGKGEGRVFVETKKSVSASKISNDTVRSENTGKEDILMSASNKVEQACCSGIVSNGGDDKKSGVEKIQANYMEFLSSVGTPSGLDAFTKQAVNIALSVAQKCGPCLKTHIEKARKMGFSDSEIDEAAWMGIAFSGSPAMMFYKENKSK